MPQKSWIPVEDDPREGLPARTRQAPSEGPFAPPASKRWVPVDDAPPSRSFETLREDGDSRWGDYLGMLTRGAGGFIGNSGGLVGAAAAGGSDALAQVFELLGGSRDKFSVGEMGVNAATGLIPFGKAASVAAGIGRGALVSAANAGATDVARQVDEGGTLDFGRAGRAAGTGALWGAGGGAGGHLLSGVFGGAGRGAGKAGQRLTRAEADALAEQGRAAAGKMAPARVGGDDAAPLPITQTRSRMKPAGPARTFEAVPDEPLTPLQTTPGESMGLAGAKQPGLLDAILPGLGDAPTPTPVPTRPIDTRGADPRTASGFRPPQTAIDLGGGNSLIYDASEALPTPGAPFVTAAPAAAPSTVHPRDLPYTPTPGKLFVPAEHVSAWQEIQRRMAEKPGTGNVENDVIAASRRWQEEPNPKRLWGLERKATAAARDRVGDRLRDPGRGGERTPPTVDQQQPDWPLTSGDAADLSGEGGFIDPVLLAKLGLHVGSGLGSATVAGLTSDDDTRTRNMISAGILGGAAPLAITNPAALARLRYASLLGGGTPQIKNLLGGIGGTLVRAAEEAGTKLLGGQADADAGDLLKGVFSPETITRMREAFAAARTATPNTIEPTRWGQTQGVLGLPSATMHAADEGFVGGLQKGGLTEDAARQALFTNAPLSKTGQKIADLAHVPTISTVVPFARTAMNMVERGLEHTPFVGELSAVKKMRGGDWQRRLVRQSLGAAALGGGALLADEIPNSVEPFVVAAMGPLALPYLMGAAGAEALDQRGDPFSNLARAPIDVLRDSMALPSDPYDWDLGRYLASYVPGLVRDASLDDPRSFSTSKSVFDPTIAKIPGLNRAVLPRKVQRPVER